MAEQPNFDNLTTAEVKSLYRQTREAAQKQRGIELAQVQAHNDFGLDGESHQDQFGNVLPGPKPPTKQIRTYVDHSGYVQELRAGESAPVP